MTVIGVGTGSTGAERASDITWMAVSPIDERIDGRCSAERSRNRCMTSTGGAVPIGFDAGSSSHARSTRPTSAALAASALSVRRSWASRSDAERRSEAIACWPTERTSSAGGMASS